MPAPGDPGQQGCRELQCCTNLCGDSVYAGHQQRRVVLILKEVVPRLGPGQGHQLRNVERRAGEGLRIDLLSARPLGSSAVDGVVVSRHL